MNGRHTITEILGRSEQGITRPFRCSESKTILTADAHSLTNELFHRYVRMEVPAPQVVPLAAA